jgi:hypothetical protein
MVFLSFSFPLQIPVKYTQLKHWLNELTARVSLFSEEIPPFPPEPSNLVINDNDKSPIQKSHLMSQVALGVSRNDSLFQSFHKKNAPLKPTMTTSAAFPALACPKARKAHCSRSRMKRVARPRACMVASVFVPSIPVSTSPGRSRPASQPPAAAALLYSVHVHWYPRSARLDLGYAARPHVLVVVVRVRGWVPLYPLNFALAFFLCRSFAADDVVQAAYCFCCGFLGAAALSGLVRDRIIVL